MGGPEAVRRQRVLEAAGVLARAFAEDPFYVHVMPDEAARPAQLLWWMARLTAYGYRHGRVLTTAGPLTGAAIWLGPDEPRVSSLRMARAGMVGVPFRLGIRATRRLMELSGEWSPLQRREPPRHFYLMAIGVDPRHQGRGTGSSLMAPVLAEADRAGLSCYLETMTGADVRFYLRHGFQVASEGRVGGLLPYWTMRRPARHRPRSADPGTPEQEA